MVAVLIRGDHEANEVKIQRLLRVTDLALADPAVVERVTGAPVGFAGPIGLNTSGSLPTTRSKPCVT